jgi:hypothetical protein
MRNRIDDGEPRRGILAAGLTSLVDGPRAPRSTFRMILERLIPERLVPGRLVPERWSAAAPSR